MGDIFRTAGRAVGRALKYPYPEGRTAESRSISIIFTACPVTPLKFTEPLVERK